MQLTYQEEPTRNHSEVSALRVLSPVLLYFVSAGIATVMLGPLLPSLIQRWQIRDSQAGTLFLVNFFGQLCGSWFAARNLKASILYGSALTAAGCVALAWLNFGAAHIAFFAIGLGLGTGLTAGNVIAGTVNPVARARLLTMLNVAWGVGAIACPLLIRLTASGGVQRFLYVAAACLATSTLIAISIPRLSRPTNVLDPSPQDIHEAATVSKFNLPLPISPLIAFCAAMFLYVGVENALGGWLPSYAVRTHPALTASSVSLVFWTAELTGRILVAVLMNLITEASLYRICLVILISVEVLLCVLYRPSAGSVTTLTIIAALSLAPVYPLLLSFLLARAGHHARVGLLFASASCGGAILPWLTGVFSTQLHGLRAGLIVPALGASLLLATSTVITTKPLRTL